MTYLNRSRWGLGLMALMLLTVGLAGCGSEPAAVATPPAPPPAPPPFQPVAVEVALGTNGGTVTLMTTEAGGHTLNGEAFASGTEVEGNGSTYTLTLDGTWSAAYKPPPAMSLALGTTGGELMIERLENGSYQANGAALASGDTVTATNDNMYTVTISDDGTPSAAYVVPAALSIPLGLSEDTVAIVKNEDGTYSVNGEVLTADTRVMAANGNVYGALLAPDGTPIGVMHIAAMLEVMLGELGGTITLTQAEDKSWWLGEMAVMDGDEYMAANGNTYTLVSDGTTWSAAYTQPPAMSLALGTTGGELMIERLEDGSYQANGAALASGDTVPAENGNNMYTVTISDDGTPSAAYVVPAALSIRLGLSGDTAAIVKNEDGTYSVDGEVLTANTEVMAANGNVYGALLAPDGTPAAEAMYIAAMQEAMLGELGGTITLKQGEDKAWWLGEMAVMDGDEYTAGNGNTYVLMMDEAGRWSGMYQKVEVMVALGTQRSITLGQAEDMSWWYGTEGVMIGSEVWSANGNTYTLWYTDGVWTARFEPEAMAITGTGLTAYTREAADAVYTVGGSDDTLTDGVGDVTADGAMYHVWAQDGELMGARFAKAIEAGTDTRRAVGDLGSKMLHEEASVFSLSKDDAKTPGDELRTHLVVDGEMFSIADLLDSGMASTMGDNFVAEALMKIQVTRAEVDTLLGLNLDSVPQNQALDQQWKAVTDQLDKVFGAGNGDSYTGGFGADADGTFDNVEGARNPGEDEILDEIDEIITALSSADNFAVATAKDDKGVFKEAELSADNAAAAYARTMSAASATMGVTGSTRYGTVSKTATDDAVTKLKYAPAEGSDTTDVEDDDVALVGQQGAFSYSTVPETVRTRHIVHTGNAYYSGETHAISGSGTVYTGKIGVQVRFSSMTVSGLVTDFADAGGNAWEYRYGDVETIRLPAARLSSNARWAVTVAASTGDISTTSMLAQATFAARAGSPAPQAIAGGATFHGILLGTGANSGSEANGTWSAGAKSDKSDYLAGAFGVVRGVDEPDSLPGIDDGSSTETSIVAMIGEDDAATAIGGAELKDKMLKLKVKEYDYTIAARADDSLLDISTFPTWQIQTTTPVDGGTATENTVDLNIGLAELLSSGQETFDSEKHVVAQVAVIMKQRNQLEGLQGLGTRIGESERTAWQKVQEALFRVFGLVPPKLNKTYADVEDEAVSLIDDALAAFGSTAELDDALDPEGSGIFKGVTDNKDSKVTVRGGGARTPANILGARQVQVLSRLGSTSYTRFGVWRMMRNRNAVRSDRGEDGTDEIRDRADDAGADGPGMYAYSQLDPTEIRSLNDPSYQQGGSATYVGETVALQNSTYLTGEVEATVNWSSTVVGGTLNVTFSNLANDSGDMLATETDPAVETDGVITTPAQYNVIRDLVFNNIDVGTMDGKVVFDHESIGTRTAGVFAVRLRHADASQEDGTGAGMIEGKFVGATVDGPQGLFGIWDLTPQATLGRVTGAGNDVTDKNAAIYGAFGAELP